MKQNLVKKVLVIFGHPKLESYNNALSQAYERGARAGGAEVKRLELANLQFSVTEAPDYSKTGELEPSLKEAQELIRWADHLVFVYPTYWGDMPALLKGFIDQVFLPNFAFKYRKGSPFPEKLLKGKTARIITTMDAPVLWHYAVTRSPGINALKRATLHFCGVNPVKVTAFGQLRYSSEVKRKGWLEKIETLAARDARQKNSKAPSLATPAQHS
ncbi:MAG: NAD(P)H-dependent oxidoreductase [Trueperaceae bacterium]